MKRILVTGATGFIGYEVARQLIVAGYRPRLMVRRPERGALFSRWPADLVQADLESRGSLRRAVEAKGLPRRENGYRRHLQRWGRAWRTSPFGSVVFWKVWKRQKSGWVGRHVRARLC